MKFTYLLANIIILLSTSGCHQLPTIIDKDSSVEKKKFREAYIYASTLMTSKSDSSFYYFNKIATSSKDSTTIAGAFTCMGIIQHDLGDYFGSQESLLAALKVLNDQNVKHHDHLASAYTCIGRNNLSLQNYDDAIDNYNKAISYAKEDIYQIIRYNNLGVAYKEKKEYDKAINIYNSILNSSKNDSIEYARILSNLAYTKWLKDPDYDAVPQLQAALEIRKVENDNWGISASFMHLSDFYAKTQLDSSLSYARRLYNVSEKLNSPDEILNALSILIKLERPSIAQQHFKRYKSLSDSLQITRNGAKNQFALIRYETEKHKTDKLELQKENAEAQLRVIWLQVSSVILVIAAISGFIWYRNRKERTMRNRELRTSQKVHDVVANGIYSIMAKLEYEPEIIKDDLLDEMEILYEQSRDLSHEGPGVIIKGFDKDIARLITSFSSQLTRVAIVGNTPTLWKSVKPAVQNEILLVVKEFLINMKKHSAAQNVVIKFNHSNEGLQIQYTDDGIGLPNVITYGRGLKSTENRIITIGGRITFDNSIPKGLKIDIIIPTIHL